MSSNWCIMRLSFWTERLSQFPFFLIFCRGVAGRNPVLTPCSVQFSRSVVSDSSQPHELQHTRPPCPSPTPGVYSNSCPSSQWCHPAIASSVIPFSSCPLIPPSIRVFPNESTLHMRWPKYWSFSFSISPSSEHSGLISFRMDWLFINFTYKGTLQAFIQKLNILYFNF